MILGTVLKISSTAVVDGGGSADSATVTIYYPDGTEAVTEEDMVEASATGIWEYIFQSSEVDASEPGQEGIYELIITVLSGDYAAKAHGTFKLSVEP